MSRLQFVISPMKMMTMMAMTVMIPSILSTLNFCVKSSIACSQECIQQRFVPSQNRTKASTGGRCCICTRQTLRVHSPDGSTFLREKTSLRSWRHIRRIYLKNNSVKFHPNPIRKDGALSFFEERRPMGYGMGSVPGLKITGSIFV